MNRFPRVLGVRAGYDPDQVDALVRRIEGTLGRGSLEGEPITADEIRDARFRTKLGGYHEIAVDFALEAFIVAVETRPAESHRQVPPRPRPRREQPPAPAGGSAGSAEPHAPAGEDVQAGESRTAAGEDVQAGESRTAAGESGWAEDEPHASSGEDVRSGEPRMSTGESGWSVEPHVPAGGSGRADEPHPSAGENGWAAESHASAEGSPSVADPRSTGEGARAGDLPPASEEYAEEEYAEFAEYATSEETLAASEEHAARVERAAFRAGRLGMGYNEDQVDAFLDRVVATLRGTTDQPVTPGDVRAARFATVILKPGYAVSEVDEFLTDLAGVLEAHLGR
ncbi:DivIVA domain-containing protein [Streptosporangium minutum]|uniref:DivIVA domain-containing protein n=1 Tax=Streptosporangium minutum TaxID=569862 RepID=UPI0013FDC7F6|nr:DivIVA domain-containing protein [Streptosporangium minutum]